MYNSTNFVLKFISQLFSVFRIFFKHAFYKTISLVFTNLDHLQQLSARNDIDKCVLCYIQNPQGLSFLLGGNQAKQQKLFHKLTRDFLHQLTTMNNISESSPFITDVSKSSPVGKNQTKDNKYCMQTLLLHQLTNLIPTTSGEPHHRQSPQQGVGADGKG